MTARITGAWGDYFRFSSEAGDGTARTKSAVFRDVPPEGRPTTGDYVDLDYNPHGESRILAVLPRSSVFLRADPDGDGRKAQVIAANFDTLFYVTSANANFSVARYERFLEIATDSGCRDKVAVILSKIDLAEDMLEELTAALREASPDVPLLALSVVSQKGLEYLAPYAQVGKTIAFVGSSGVGKSSLVNYLAGEFVADTCEVQAWSDKGRHTTTARELRVLKSGVAVIDTPGLREFGTLDRTPDYRRKDRHERRISNHRFRG